MIVDAGPLISADRDRRAFAGLVAACLEVGESLRTTEVVVAQVWRDFRQVNLAAALKAIEIHAEFGNGRRIGELLGTAGTTDPIDAHLVILARRLNERVLTADVKDLRRLAAVVEVPVVEWRE